MFETINGDGDLAIFNICFDQGFVLTNLQHNTRAPDEAIVNLLVHADNKAGDDAGGQDGVGIFKGRDAVEFQFGGFVFGEQVRDEEGLIRFYIVAQFELFHHIHDEEAFVAWIPVNIQYTVEHGEGKNAFVSKKFVRVENFVHPIRDPLRVENAERFEAGIILKVQDNAEIVEEADQRALTGFVADFVLGTQFEIFVVGDEIGLFAQFFQFGFDGEPGFGQQVADVWQVVDLLGDSGFEFFNACACGGGGFEDTDDVGIFLL